MYREHSRVHVGKGKKLHLPSSLLFTQKCFYYNYHCINITLELIHHFISHPHNHTAVCWTVLNRYRITGIVRGRKVSRIAFFAVVREKTFAIQAISYIKIPAEIKSARKHSRILPDSWNFSSTDDSRYTVLHIIVMAACIPNIVMCIHKYLPAYSRSLPINTWLVW